MVLAAQLRIHQRVVVASAWVLTVLCAFTPAEVSAESGIESFEKEIRPLLVEHCYQCHSTGGKKLQAGLLVDSRAALLAGGDSGPAIEPGDADASLLIEAIRYESYEMPPKGKLPDDAIKAIEKWVELGAPWPEEETPTGEETRNTFDLKARAAEHWVWQPIQSPAIPSVDQTNWPRGEIDRFILARLEKAGLDPAGEAPRDALVRRLYFDLIGLPPTPEQLNDAVNDQHPDAIERLVDQLLESQHFGERWGRHWLDLTRYAESRGHEFDNDTQNAYQYRDYVIRALNADVPHDQLVREHIAGDLLGSPRLHPEQGFNESILGTGFWFLGEWVHSPVDIRKDEADRFDNMIDVMSKTFLGVTVSCARCHDHKFDAISTADYYSLSGFLQSSDYRQVRFESLEHNRQIAAQLAKLDERYQREIAGLLLNSGAKQMPNQPPGASPRLFDHPSQISGASALRLKRDGSVAVDYGTISADRYLQDGFIFGQRPRRLGEAYMSSEDGTPKLQFATRTAAVSDPFWDDLQSISEKGSHNKSALVKLPRPGRTLRTPTFTLKQGDVACLVRGKGHVVACVDSHRLIAGPLHKQTIVSIEPGQPWARLDLNRYVGHRLHLEFTPATDSQLEVAMVLQGASAEVLKEIEAAQVAVEAAVDRHSRAVNGWLTEDDVTQNRVKKLIRSWADQRTELRSQIRRESRLAMAMADGTGEDDRVLIRGSTANPGKIAARRFLTAISGQPISVDAGSGRLELARHINDPANPLTARVIVNRIWHYLMGRGIVPTTDDFGALGQKPTHPQLLDHLATRWLSDGRSIKQMIRYIVLSRTYQMSSQPDPSAVAADPTNSLWHHLPPKRLEGEVIRDALLAISGRLDESMFGEPIPIHLTDFMDGRGRPEQSGPLDGGGRRSIYISVRRNFLSPFMLTFDTPVPFSTMGRRNVSNVPAQALILMNDPLVVDLAGAWAERAMEQHATVESRIRWLYQTAFARLPTEQETAAATNFLSADSTDIDAWSDFAHALINTKEFIFLR
jgi:cytochrome c553